MLVVGVVLLVLVGVDVMLGVCVREAVMLFVFVAVSDELGVLVRLSEALFDELAVLVACGDEGHRKGVQR